MTHENKTSLDIIADLKEQLATEQEKNKRYRGALEYNAIQPCEGPDNLIECANSGMGIDSYCYPCFAKQALKGDPPCGMTDTSTS